MVGHTFAKLCATTIDMYLSDLFEKTKFRVRGQAGFRKDHQIIDHIFTLHAIIQESKQRSTKVYCYFVDFRKAFDSVSRHFLFECLHAIGVSDLLVTAIMKFYENVVGHFLTPQGLSGYINNIIGVK